MSRCGYQQKAFVVGCVAGEMRRAGAAASAVAGDSSFLSDDVVCPKPRRPGLGLLYEPGRPSRFAHINNQQQEACESNAGRELLDMILNKGNYGADKPNFEVASSPPYFFGSPPSRVSNPVIQDAQFGNNSFNPFSPSLLEAPPSPSSSSARKNGGGCARMKFGQKPAQVRIEGFNCRGSCSISAVA